MRRVWPNSGTESVIPETTPKPPYCNELRECRRVRTRYHGHSAATMRILLFALIGVLGQPVFAGEVSPPRRLFILTQAFLDSAPVRAIPDNLPGDRSRVLVLFRLSEAGTVIDVRATGGSEKAQKSALNVVRTWRFKPTLLKGQPIQMQSGSVVDFSSSPVSIKAPQPMSAEQISPVLSARCSLAISSASPETLSICRKEADKVLNNSVHTPMEALTAHYELGIALLDSGDASNAVRELDEAIRLAPTGLTQGDGEWGRLYWHRAAAQAHLGKSDLALADLNSAAAAFSRAGEGTGLSTYRDLLSEVSAKKAILLQKEASTGPSHQ